MTYTHLTSEERNTLSTLKMEGFSNRQISRCLGRSPSTIGRELSRNRCPHDGAYRVSKAHSRAMTRRVNSRRNQQFGPEDLKRAYELIRLYWSPEQVSGYLAKTKELYISHETLYRYIWKDQKNLGDLHTCLRRSQKLRHKRYRSHDSRGKLPNKRHISERPRIIETRSTLGHWEIDTVMGSSDKHCVVTIVERKSRFLILGKLRCRTKDELNKRVIQLINRHLHHFKTITADNGTEFHGYQIIESKTDTRFYFANPHHSWERGTNENTNGLIRQYLPKGRSMATLTQHQCNSIAHKLNSRPRKTHGYKTPEDILYGC